MRRGGAVWLGAAILTAAAPDSSLLWDPARPVPAASEAPLLADVEFSVIKRHEPEVDGYEWLHGVAIVRHKGVMYASWGHNQGAENTATEIVQGSRSRDGGRTWSPVELMAKGAEGTAISHGVFFSHGGRLWAFLATFQGRRQSVRTQAFLLDEKSGRWTSRGIVAEGGFWPLAEPVRMANGNWIMGGAVIDGKQNPAAAAISRGKDFTRWDVSVAPNPEGYQMWGETAVIAEGREVTAIARYGAKALALVATSRDYGRTFSAIRESNLPMATSKPYAGQLSTGQRYLVCTTASDTGKARAPLTVAVSRPGGRQFVKVYRIRDAIRPGENAATRATLAYPYAVEYDGRLYVAYSVGRRGGNRNAAELAVIPVTSLAAE